MNQAGTKMGKKLNGSSPEFKSVDLFQFRWIANPEFQLTAHLLPHDPLSKDSQDNKNAPSIYSVIKSIPLFLRATCYDAKSGNNFRELEMEIAVTPRNSELE